MVFRTLLAFIALWFAACAGHVIDTSKTFTKVVIDAGHGGQDRGATSRWAGQEKDHALAVALLLKPRLEAAGFETVMTRSTDVFIPLDTRARISNRTGDCIFVSIHFNDASNRSAEGAEVYYKSRCSAAIARNILNQITAVPGVESRGIKTANFRVLKKNRYPAVLVEGGFLSNPSEGVRCASSLFHDSLAEAIARGIIIQRHGGVVMTAGR